MRGAELDAGVALETVLAQHAADAGASVAVLTVRIGVEHPVVAVETKQVAGFLRRGHARQRNVGEDPDGRVLALVVLMVAVLHPVVQHVEERHCLRNVLLLEVREQQHKSDAGVEQLNVKQGGSQRLQRRREGRVDDDEVASLQQLLYGIILAREQGQSRQHVVQMKRSREKGAETAVHVQQSLRKQLTREATERKKREKVLVHCRCHCREALHEQMGSRCTQQSERRSA